MSRKVTAKQAVTAAIVRESVKAGVPLSRDLLLTAHVEGYELSPTGDKSARQVASAYVTRNMRSPEFMAEVGLEASTARRSSTRFWFTTLTARIMRIVRRRTRKPISLSH
jgi:hypothetical protein